MQDSEAAVNKLWKLLQASRRHKKLLSVHLQELLVVFVYMCWFIVLLVDLVFLRVEFIQLCAKALQKAEGTCNQVIAFPSKRLPCFICSTL